MRRVTDVSLHYERLQVPKKSASKERLVLTEAVFRSMPKALKFCESGLHKVIKSLEMKNRIK